MRSSLALSAIACLLACARNPVSHKMELALITEAQEVQMGKDATLQVEQQMGFYKDPKVEEYVNNLGQALAKKTERPTLPWQFHVVDDSSVNAFALPGGSIFVTRGILGALKNEAELAAVMGHECGHVAARHSVRMISRQELAQVGLGIGMVLSPQLRNLGQAAGAGMQLLFLKFSRDAEGQADELGLRYMQSGGYDPRQMLPLFSTLMGVGQIAMARAQAAGGNGARLPEYLATHPYPEQRLKDAQTRIERLKGAFGEAKVDPQPYLKVIDGIVYGEDPRAGYFQGQTFLHPGLKFQMTFPQGWKMQNMPQALTGVGPKQDVAIQLAPAGNITPEQAAQKFFAQQGVKQGKAAQGNIHGDAAIQAYFGATDPQQGELAGLVTFVQHGGATYAMFGYTSAQALPQHDAEFRAVMGSFAPLTDPKALAVQPARVQLVPVPTEMTIAQFAQQYPSNAPLDELALINGVDKDGKLPAGSMAKRVVGGPERTQLPARADATSSTR